MSKSSDPLSFEDLGAIYRQEKKSPLLCAVRRDLYPAMAALIKKLRTDYEDCLAADPDSILCEGVNLKRKKVVSQSLEITEMRMGKINAMALIGARGGSNVLDNFTSEEKEYYKDVLALSQKHLQTVERLNGKKKFETTDLAPEPPTKKTAEPKAKQAPVEEPETLPAAEQEEMFVIRILEDLPPFSGPDRNYELSKEDIVRMPKEMAQILISREKAEQINPAP